MKVRAGLVMAAALAAFASDAAVAATRTGQVAVRAKVTGGCEIATSEFDFGAVAPGTPARTTATLTVQCAPHDNVTIFVGPGSSGNPKKRTMRSGSDLLGYQLYRDAAHTDPIDDNGITFHLRPNDNDGQKVTYPVYGEIPSGQDAPQGTYTDTVQVTVNY